MREIICRMFGHRVDRRRVWHDDHEYRATCTVCRRPLIRGLGPWRLFNSSTDASVKRKPHPHSQIRK
jgi:hypothetical protein